MVSTAVLIGALTTVAGYFIVKILTHPLRHFPGPHLAALTNLYTAYYDIVQHGALLRHITALHKYYGPVVRIGPNELSFCDPSAYNDIFAPGSKFTKEQAYYQGFCVPQSTFGCINAQESKFRRDRLKPLFSRRAILSLSHVVEDKVDQLILRLVTEQNDRQIVNLFMAFRCTSLEIITSYCLGTSLNALEYPEFRHPFLVSLQRAIPFFWILKYFPFLTPIMVNPPKIARYLGLVDEGVFEFRRLIAKDIDQVLWRPEVMLDTRSETIYHHLLSSYQSRLHLTVGHEEILQEALAAILAGSDTVGNACTVGFFHILGDPQIKKKLVAELDKAWPDAESHMDITDLEKLPYLTAVIKEALRLAYGVVSPVPRVVGPTDSFIGGVLVPAGTIVSMSSVFVHNNPEIFREPLKFIPERWLDDHSSVLESHLVPFSKGPRSCLGVNLAWSELYSLFGTLFRKLNIEPYDIEHADYTSFDAFFVPVHCGKHLRATIQRRVH